MLSINIENTKTHFLSKVFLIFVYQRYNNMICGMLFSGTNLIYNYTELVVVHYFLKKILIILIIMKE